MHHVSESRPFPYHETLKSLTPPKKKPQCLPIDMIVCACFPFVKWLELQAKFTLPSKVVMKLEKIYHKHSDILIGKLIQRLLGILPKLREGNVFNRVCLSASLFVCSWWGGRHVTTPHMDMFKLVHLERPTHPLN